MEFLKPVIIELTRIECAEIECNKLEDLERELNIFLLSNSPFEKMKFDFLGSNIDIEKTKLDQNAKCQIRRFSETIGFAKTGKEIMDILYLTTIK